MNVSLVFEYLALQCSEHIPRPLRIFAALLLGVMIYIVTDHAHDVTQSGTMFAEMFHALGDIVEILAYSVALLTVGKVGRYVARISGALVCIGGFVPLYKAWNNALIVIYGDNYIFRDVHTLAITSLLVLVLIFLQIVLIAKEHSDFCGEGDHHHGHHNHIHHHGHAHSHGKEHVKDSHHALMTHFWSDILMNALALVLVIIMITLPDAKTLLMLMDIGFTTIIGIWMVRRGWGVFIKK